MFSANRKEKGKTYWRHAGLWRLFHWELVCIAPTQVPPIKGTSSLQLSEHPVDKQEQH